MAEKKVTLETEKLKARPNTAVNSGRTMVSKPTISTNLTINMNRLESGETSPLSNLMKPDWYKFRPQTGRRI